MSDVSEEAMRLEALEGSGEGGELEQAESMLAMLDENDALCECQRYLRKHGESASAELVLAIVTHCINVRMDAPTKCLQQVLRLAVAVGPPRDLHSQVLASLISNIAPLSDDPVEHVPGPQPGADRIAILVEALSLLMPRLSDRKRPWAFVRHSEDAVHRASDDDNLSHAQNQLLSAIVAFVQNCRTLANRIDSAQNKSFHETRRIHARFVRDASQFPDDAIPRAVVTLANASGTFSEEISLDTAKEHFSEQLDYDSKRADDASADEHALRAALGTICCLSSTCSMPAADVYRYLDALLKIRSPPAESRALDALRQVKCAADRSEAVMLCQSLQDTLAQSPSCDNRLRAHEVKDAVLSTLGERDRLEAMKELLHDGNAHPAAAALLLCRLKREIQNAWESGISDSPFVGPEPLSVSVVCIQSAIDHQVDENEIELSADVIVGAINVVRFVLLRQAASDWDATRVMPRAKQLEYMLGSVRERMQTFTGLSLALQTIEQVATDAQHAARSLLSQ